MSREFPASVRYMARSSATDAEDRLRHWAEVNAMRDEVVREAVAAGVSIREIQQITGITRTNIMRILAHGPRRPRLRLISSD
jgi:hypothetical protein